MPSRLQVSSSFIISLCVALSALGCSDSDTPLWAAAGSASSTAGSAGASASTVASSAGMASGGGSGDAALAPISGAAGSAELGGSAGAGGGGGASGAGGTGSVVTDPGPEGDGDFYVAPPYDYGPDSEKHDGVPEGKLTSFEWNSSKIFPGTARKVYMYAPAQYDGSKQVPVMVIMDGTEPWAYLEGDYRPRIVLDNLIQQKRIPVMIAVFIDHSNLMDDPNKNRSYEYDTVHDLHARFVLEEILPEVEKSFKLTHDPEGRGAMGESSGGIAAFCMGWFKPDGFRRLASHSGTFKDIRGGNVVDSLVADNPAKPLRVYMNDGTKDSAESWQENQNIAAALKAKGYHYRFVHGEDVHGGMHGAVDLPSALEWLWRGYPK